VVLGIGSTTGILWIRWSCYEPTRSHDKVLDLMRVVIYFLLAIELGRALVIQEAMSQGLPIIITANTGS
jgi:hypothetical protein